MLIRIFLIIALVGGLAAAGINLFVVKDKIVTTITERDQFHTERDKEAEDKRKAQTDAKNTHAALDKTKEELASTQKERDDAVTEAGKQKQIATKVSEELTKTTQERDDARANLAAWDTLGIPVNKVREIIAQLKQAMADQEALQEEKRVLLAKVARQEKKINDLIGEGDRVVELPAGLKGKILVCDPKYDFVVLDIGEKQGAKEDGQMLVNHEGKLVAKVRIKSVQTDRSIANIMPGWKMSDVMEGDQVVY
jgi:hypothetical protein